MRIELEDVRHVYTPGTPFEVEALRGVSLAVEPDETLGIVGGTGSGKSTLAQHLNLLLAPTSGRVLVDGADARTLKGVELRRRVGLVFQFPEAALFAPTVEEDVAFAPRRLGLDEEETRERVSETLELLGADRALVLNAGRLVSDVPPDRLVSDAELLRENRLALPTTLRLAAGLGLGAAKPRKPEELAAAVLRMVKQGVEAR